MPSAASRRRARNAPAQLIRIRSAHKTPDGHYAGPLPDQSEATRVRESLAVARSLRRSGYELP